MLLSRHRALREGEGPEAIQQQRVCVCGKLFAMFEIDLIALRGVKEQAELVPCLCVVWL